MLMFEGRNGGIELVAWPNKEIRRLKFDELWERVFRF